MRDEKEINMKEQSKTINLDTPISEDAIRALHAGDFVEIGGTMLWGRDV